MAKRIIKNYTATDREINDLGSIVIPAGGQIDLAEQCTLEEIANSDDLLAILGEGIDKFQVNDGVNDLSLGDGIDLIRRIVQKFPVTSDKRAIFMPTLWRGDLISYHTGTGDDIVNGIKGEGEEFQIISSVIEVVEKEFQFLEFVYLAGGGYRWSGASIGDWVSLLLYAPASPVVANATNTGNCDLSDAGGSLPAPILIVPNSANTGAYDVNLSEKYNANVNFTKVVPVPSEDETGFVDWNEDTEEVTWNLEQKGKFNLFVADIDLARFVNKVRLMGNGYRELTIPAVKAKKILPHWRFKVSLNNSGNKTLEFIWDLVTARKKTI